MATYSQTISTSNYASTWDVGTSNFAINSSYCGKTNVGGAMSSAMLFTNVTVTKGSTITSATLSINVQGVTTATFATMAYGEDADSASAVSSVADGESRTRTTANADTGIASSGVNNINVKTIVEEIIARAGWSSGNNIQFLLDDNGSDANKFWYSGAVSSYDRSLTIEYSPAGWQHKANGISTPTKVNGITLLSTSKINGI